MLKNKNRFHEPLAEGDSVSKTVGCRHAFPDNCRRNGLPRICAFVRKDGMCVEPASSWKKQYEKLKKMGK